MFIPMWVIVGVVVILYLLLPSLLSIFIKNDKTLYKLSLVYKTVFFACLAICVFSTVTIGKDGVLIEFINNGKWCSKNISFEFKADKVDILINIAMLFPIGFTTMAKARYREKKNAILLALLIGLCTGSVIELFQFILPVNRSVQLSDIVYNGISGFLGGCYFYLLNLISTKKRKEINN